MNIEPSALNRRGMLRVAGMGTAASFSRVLGANDRIRGAMIGCGIRGTGAILPGAALQADHEMVAVCDVYKTNLDRALSLARAKGGKVEGHEDYRRIIDRKDIDVVYVATPDHWHSPMTVAACEAGKDVYVEKPLANNIEDCLKLLAAHAQYRRVIQVGLQQRTMKIYHDALRRIREGSIGKVRRCTMVWPAEWASPPRDQSKIGAPPEGLNWEMFQGPAPRRPYQPLRQLQWRTFPEYGCGHITDLGVHMLDVVHWFMGVDTPQMTFAVGHYSSRTAEQVPDIFEVLWKYEGFAVCDSSRREDDWANTFWGETGSLSVNRSVLRIKPYINAGQPRGAITEIRDVVGDATPIACEDHIRNFLDCVRSRRKPIVDAHTGFTSTLPCLLAVMSVAANRPYTWDGKSARAV